MPERAGLRAATRRLAPALAAAVLGATASACSDDAEREGPARVDERRGSFRGVALGDPPRSVQQALGRAVVGGVYDPVVPTGLPDDAPLTFGSAAPPSRGRASAVRVFRYRDVSFAATPQDGVFEILISAQGATTSRGVAIGDPLADARREHRGLACGTKHAGTEYESFRYCSGRVGDGTFVWFGGDPITSITLTRTPMVGPDVRPLDTGA